MKKFSNKTGDDQDMIAILEKQYQLNKVLKQKADDQETIQKAQQNWKIIKKKIKVIRMMSSMGAQNVLAMRERSKKKDEQQVFENEESWTSKLIIPPNNFWNMQWNNFVTTVFVFYIFIAPIFISFKTEFTP